MFCNVDAESIFPVYHLQILVKICDFVVCGIKTYSQTCEYQLFYLTLQKLLVYADNI